MVKRFLIFATLGILFFSCIKDEPIPELVDDGTVMFVGEDYQPATKTTLNGLQTEWVANTDKVGLFSLQASKEIGGAPGVVNEPLTALSSGARSQFSGSVYWNTGEHTFYSYYPYAAGTPPHTAVPVSLPSSQRQTAVNRRGHLSSLDFLVAKPHTAKYPGFSGAPATVSLRYNHLFCIIEFQIKRTSGSGAIKKVRLRGSEPLAFESGTINLSQSVPGAEAPYVIDGVTNTSKSVTVELDTTFSPTNVNFSVAPKVNMVVLPGKHTGDVNIGFEINNVYYEVAKSGIEFKRGKKYTVQVDVTGASKVVIKGSDLKPVTIGDLMWAPVNVGYREDLKQGELFQWHRKYGFGLSVAVYPTSHEFATSLWRVDLDQETAQDKYRDVFLKNGVDPKDWCPVLQTEWNNSQKFNPCPEGWRLPTKSEFDALIKIGVTNIGTTNGGVDDLLGKWIGPYHDDSERRATTAVFFPITGYFTVSATAGRANATSHGLYWASSRPSPPTKLADYMQFTTSASTPSLPSTDRASGLAVRCVKDVTPSPNAILYTIKPNDISHDGAKVGGNIEYQGSHPITERGVFFGTAVDPSVNKVVAQTGGIGEFTVNLNLLNEITTYYVRAYAKNSAGTTYYGDQYKFTTLAQQPQYEGKEVEINGLTWAPWNAGYNENTHKAGLLYQWHRKYGMNGEVTANTPAPIIISGPLHADTVNLPKYQNFFINSSTDPYNHISPVKTTWSMVRNYNPCPDGWRVPSLTEFQSLVSSGHSYGTNSQGMPGRWFGPNHAGSKEGCVFLPYNGYRDRWNGFVNQSNSGFYWTLTSGISGFSGYSVYLNFGNSYLVIDANNTAIRSFAMSIRCVK
jgi:uncharacterized protein (TIGR02145 family)